MTITIIHYLKTLIIFLNVIIAVAIVDVVVGII